MKSFTAIFFSILFMFSIMAPSALLMFDIDKEPIVFLDTTEEESQSKTENNSEDIEMEVDDQHSFASVWLSGNFDASKFNKDIFSSFTSKIDLPPPEFIG